MNLDNILRRFTSTKFVLTISTMAAIVAIAILQPTALTSELIFGLLGAVATYSGSNSFLTAMAQRESKKAPAVEQQAADPLAEREERSERVERLQTIEQELQNLEQRVSQNERTTAEMIEIIKQLMNRK